MDYKLLDLYSDYVLLSFSQTTATGLSALSGNAVTHDKISRFLNGKAQGGKELWLKSKPLIRRHEQEDACLVFDDTIIEKPHSQENELVCWHYDHSKGRSVKGVNLLTAFYHTSSVEGSDLQLPFSYELIQKTRMYCEISTKDVKRKSEKTKNTLLQEMLAQALHNQLKFKYVLADSWFASCDNMRFIHKKAKKTFIFDMKCNRKVCLTEDDRNQGRWTRLDELKITTNEAVKVWIKDLAFPLLLCKQVFTNKNASTGCRFLVSNDLDLNEQQFMTIYKKRWSVEVYHKSLKQNASVAKSPTSVVRTQSNHIFASMVGYLKLEKMRLSRALNHFAIKSKIYIAAMKAAQQELNNLQHKSGFA